MIFINILLPILTIILILPLLPPLLLVVLYKYRHNEHLKFKLLLLHMAYQFSFLDFYRVMYT